MSANWYVCGDKNKISGQIAKLKNRQKWSVKEIVYHFSRILFITRISLKKRKWNERNNVFQTYLNSP